MLDNHVMNTGHGRMAEPKNLSLVLGVPLQLIGLAVVIYRLNKVNTSIRVSAQAALYPQGRVDTFAAGGISLPAQEFLLRRKDR